MPLGMLGKYERLDVLGHGVSGIVYLAKDTLLNKQVALKEVDVQAGDVRRFLEEARVMDRLRHPNIVRVNGVDRIDGKIVIDMEYVRGQNLQELLRREGRLPVDRALDIAVQTLDALDYAHQMQTVHRDIKPANILIDREGRVKLVDFGLAEILATNAYAGGAGTYAYMAPEDFAEEDRSDSQSDVWAVGVTLFEMLTAHRPFQVTKVKDPFSWKRALETELPAPLSDYLDVPPALQTILDRALCRDKRQRYLTAGDFQRDLQCLRSGERLEETTLRVGDMVSALRASDGDGPTQTLFPERAYPEPEYHFPPIPVTPTISTEDYSPPSLATEARIPVFEAAAGTSRPMESAVPESQSARGPFADSLPASPPDVAVVQPIKPKRKLPFASRKSEPRLSVEPERVEFGSIRKGDLGAAKLQVRIQGVEGKIEGRVLHTPGWLTVHPAAFDKARQVITLTAHTARAWETGEFRDLVRIETNAGTTEVPVLLHVLKPRPTFGQVAAWYLPLFAATLLPVIVAATGGGDHALSSQTASLVPAAALGSALLALMLLFVCIAQDVGVSERIACGVSVAVMCFVLGMAFAAQSTPQFHHVAALGLQRAFLVGVVLGGVLLLQLLHLKRWKLWGGALVGLSLALSYTLLHTLH